MKKKVKIYFAAPLFKQAERIWNRMIKNVLKKRAENYGFKIKIIFPQDIATKILNNERRSEEYNLSLLSRLLRKKIFEADIIVSILDGVDVESGTSAETYFAKHGANKKVIGIRTDFRKSGEERGLNLIISRAVDEFIYFPSFNEDHEELAEKILEKIKELIK